VSGWVYSLGLGLFMGALLPSVLAQMLVRGKYRRGLAERFGRPQPWEGSATPLWLHAVSVGEAMAAAPLARELARRRPDVPLLVSTTTETGRAVAEQRLPASRFVFFPVDLAWIVRPTLARLRPRAVLLTETELWPNFLTACAAQAVPCVLINGRISPRSFPRYRLVRPYFRTVLRHMRLFCMQSQADADRILALGAPPDRVVVTGNLKYDLPTLGQGENREDLRGRLGLDPACRLIVAGSTHRGEEEAVLEAFQGVAADRRSLALLLAPRHPERLEEVERLVLRRGLGCVRRSRLPGAGPVSNGVILLDTMGELATLYGAATVVFIGGSLIPHGGQNLLEPAAWGRPVIHGPHMGNFAEMRERFLAAGAAVEIPDGAGLTRALGDLVDDPGKADRMGAAGRGIVEANRGATARTADLVEGLL
jgi:3-deoxy-D-manno-octulosonic-acid transferase